METGIETEWYKKQINNYVEVKRITCECGIEFIPRNYNTHIHTQTHIQHMKLKYQCLNIARVNMDGGTP